MIQLPKFSGLISMLDTRLSRELCSLSILLRKWVVIQISLTCKSPKMATCNEIRENTFFQIIQEDKLHLQAHDQRYFESGSGKSNFMNVINTKVH